MNAVSFVAYCGELAGLGARGRDAARARGAVLRWPRRGTLPECRDLLDRHEAAHQARAGARPRSGSAVPRRAHQRHGPEGARRDAGAHARSGAQQGRQPDSLVAPPARRRIHVRPRRRHGQGPRSRPRGRSTSSKVRAAACSRCAQRRGTRPPRRGCSRPLAWSATRPTKTSCASSCPGEVSARDVFRAGRAAKAFSCGTCVRACPTLEDVFARAVGED